MNILQVSTADIHGGAEKVAWNLFGAYRKRGHCSWLAVGEKRSHDADVFVIPNQELRGRWYHRMRALSSSLEQARGWKRSFSPLGGLVGGLGEPARRLRIRLGLEDFDFPGASRLLELTTAPPDIIHAHNLHGYYFDLRMLPWLSRQLPVILTLHDAWLLSGHCAHSFDCERWKTGCGRCPDLTIYPEIRRDATGINWRRKRSIYARSRLYVATPSRWLMRKVEASMLAPGVVEARVVPNGVDLGVFHPAGRQEARARLGLPQDKKIFLITGIKIRENIWKDYETIRKSIVLVAEKLPDQQILLVALGEDGLEEAIKGVQVRFIPFTRDERIVAQYYQAADIYVHAARADTFPTGVLEALACGTPVVSTAVGGTPEQIEDTQTGFLVPPGDAQGMAARVVQLLSDGELRRAIGTQAAEKARSKFGLDKQVESYLDWYEQLVEQREP